METSYYLNEEHENFRLSVRQFLEKEVNPFIDEWEENREIPRHIWKKFGDMGYFGIEYPEQYGGMGADFFYTVVFLEEIVKTRSGGFGASIGAHPYLACSHLNAYGSDYLKEKYLRPGIAGDIFGCMAVTEPNAGSDVASIRTTAVRKGDHYIVNGSKIFITNGVLSDFIVAAVKTNPDAKAGGISMLVIDRKSVGVGANKLEKLGWHASDTGEIFFDNVEVPVENLIGEENRGFYYIMDRFQLERLVMGVSGIAMVEDALQYSLEYMSQRKAFGKSINQFQALRHRVADLASEAEALKTFAYYVCQMHKDGKYAVKEASMVKLLATELSDKATYQCLQFFGGYGYIEDYKIARMFRDSRIGTIGGGSSEIMREIIAKMVIDEVSYHNPHKDTESKVYTAVEIIRSLEERLKAEKSSGYQTIFHFDITGNNGGKFTVEIQDGKCKVGEGLTGEAQCLVETEANVYEDVELGRANPQEAMMTGKIKISNPMEMMKFSSLFRRMG